MVAGENILGTRYTNLSFHLSDQSRIRTSGMWESERNRTSKYESKVFNEFPRKVCGKRALNEDKTESIQR